MRFGNKWPISDAAWAIFIVSAFLLFSPAKAFGGGRDSVVTVTVEPGITHLTFYKDGPLIINVLIVDLTAKNIRLESYRPVGLVPTSQQAKRSDWEGHRVIAAINVDFFSFKTGWPVNNQVVNGEFAYGTQTERSHLALDNRGKAYFEKLSFDGWIKPKTGKIYAIAGVNDVHRGDAMVLHNSFSDTATSSTDSGKTVLLRPVNPTWTIGDTLRMAVMQSGNIDFTHIPHDQAALWVGGGPSVVQASKDVRAGDTILVYLGTQPVLKNIRTVSGGFGMIVSNGNAVSDSINLDEKPNVSFLQTRHPRTFVGIDRDTTRIYLCTVDGRQEKSIGMNFHEMSDFLISIGVFNAVNFDGGGSTTMVLKGKIVNSPSDKTGERPVANSLQVIRMGPYSDPK